MGSPRSRRLTITATMIELVPANKERISFVVVNPDISNSARVYSTKDQAEGGIYVYPRQWIQWEEKDAANEQWFVKRAAGTSYCHIIEFFKKKGRR